MQKQVSGSGAVRRCISGLGLFLRGAQSAQLAAARESPRAKRGGETSLVTTLWKRVTSAGERGLSAWKQARQNRFLQFPISLPHEGGERKESFSP